jgi:hypothetical protein
VYRTGPLEAGKAGPRVQFSLIGIDLDDKSCDGQLADSKGARGCKRRGHYKE